MALPLFSREHPIKVLPYKSRPKSIANFPGARVDNIAAAAGLGRVRRAQRDRGVRSRTRSKDRRSLTRLNAMTQNESVYAAK